MGNSSGGRLKSHGKRKLKLTAIYYLLEVITSIIK